MSKVQHVDKTSAEDKSIGFDFQYYYFLNKLLNLKTGETLGLEVMDDVHSVLSDNTQILIQLKYTIQKQKNGTPKNLTTLDSDFWKTVSNWVKVVTDKVADRDSVKTQLEFIERTDFLLASNKSDNVTNTTLDIIRAFQNGDKKHDELIEKIERFRSDTTDAKILEYINDVLVLNVDVSSLFFQKIRFDLGCDDIIQKCKDSIAERFIDPSRIDDVFSSIDSQLRSDNFDLVSSKKKIIVTYDSFFKKYRIHFDKARNPKLDLKRHFEVQKGEIKEQLFIRQLVDIGDVGPEDIGRMLKLFYHQLLAKNNIAGWLQLGDITSLDVESLEEDAVTNWENKHRRAFRKNVSEDNINDTALGVVDDLRAEKLSIANQEMGRPFSNGEYYDLCEQKKIGWRNDWETKYE